MIKLIGVYKIKPKEPCHLIEIEFINIDKPLNIGEIIQEYETQPKENWQVPYSEHLLNNDGKKSIADDYELLCNNSLIKDIFRLTFFFHYLNLNKELLTPFGKITINKIDKLPKRLNIIKHQRGYDSNAIPAKRTLKLLGIEIKNAH